MVGGRGAGQARNEASEASAEDMMEARLPSWVPGRMAGVAAPLGWECYESPDTEAAACARARTSHMGKNIGQVQKGPLGPDCGGPGIEKRSLGFTVK